MANLTLVYGGQNRMPAVAYNAQRPYELFAYSQGPFAYDSLTSQFLVYGHVSGQLAIRVKTAGFNNAGQSRDVTQMPKGLVVGSWHDPTMGGGQKLASEFGGLQIRTGAVVFHGSKLYQMMWRYYHVQESSLPCLAVIENGVRKGYWTINDQHCLRTSRYLDVDADGTIFTGNCEGKAAGSWGPACYEINDLDVDAAHNSRQPASELQAYTSIAPWEWEYPDQAILKKDLEYGAFSAGDNVRPQARKYPPHWRIISIVVLGDQVVYSLTRMLGAEWYGMPTPNDGHHALTDVASVSKGYHGEKRVTSLIVFPNLIRSSGTNKTYYEIPISQHLVRDVGPVHLTKDEANRSLYVLESFGDWQTLGPIIHKFSY